MTGTRTDCDARREELGLLLDGDTAATGGAELFRHLGACDGCRAFLDTLLLLRQAAARERAGAAAAADAIALPRAAGEAAPSPRSRPHRPAAAWRLPRAAAVAAALVLLVGGALLGASLTGSGAGARGAGGRPAVVVVCSLPEVVVR